MTFIAKNNTSNKLDQAQKDITSRFNRFYADEKVSYNYVLAVETLPSGLNCYYLGFNTKSEMIRAMYYIFGSCREGKVVSYNKKQSYIERLCAGHDFDTDEKGVSVFMLDDYEDWPRIYFGTYEQFELARTNKVF